MEREHLKKFLIVSKEKVSSLLRWQKKACSYAHTPNWFWIDRKSEWTGLFPEALESLHLVASGCCKWLLMCNWSSSVEPICRCHSKRNSNKIKNIINWSSFDTRYRRGFEIAFFSSFKKKVKVVCLRTGLLSSKKKTGNFFFRKDKKLLKCSLFTSPWMLRTLIFFGASQYHKTTTTSKAL